MKGEVQMKEYDVESMSLEDFKDLIASGDDTHDNQIRVTKTGKVFYRKILLVRIAWKI